MVSGENVTRTGSLADPRGNRDRFIQKSTRDMYHNEEDAGGDEKDRGDDMNEGNRVQRPPEDGWSELKGPRTGQRKEMAVSKRALTSTTCSWEYGSSMPGRVSVRPGL